jgi:D-alanyl-D-alanine carboxypeptidase (penicillin-binding protein 5/6)
VAIKLGERLCEGILLRGMLVHSAGDYAQLLVSLTGWSESHFVDQMNRDAAAMDMTKTHYADFTGISAYDRSTAHDQTIIAAALMTNEPIVRSIVALTKVRLPVVGVVISYTPLIGQDGVVGVKSGYTNLAGGCDVMTINYTVGATVITTYVVDLGQHSGNALGLAGDVNLDLSRSLRSQFARVQTPGGVSVDWLGWPGYVVAPPVTTTTSTTTSTTTTSTTTTSTTTTTIP